jgi:polyisoprenoid-binding protein YceI
MKKFTLTMAAAAMIFATACNDAPKGDTANASDAVESKEATGTELKADVNATKIEWIGSKPLGSNHKGTISIKDGSIKVEGNNVTGGKFQFDLHSLTPTDQDSTGNAKLKGHLLAPDFLDVEKYPDGFFEITNVTAGVDTSKVENKEATHTVTGNLTLKGQSKSITFPAKVSMTDSKVEAHAVFNIDRTDWGISYNSDASIKDKFINKEINITLHLVANK